MIYIRTTPEKLWEALTKPEAEMTELIVTHESDRDGSKLIEAVSGGGPKFYPALKA